MPLPPGVTLQQIDGGPSYYGNNGFTLAVAAGWDTLPVFPVGNVYPFYPGNSTSLFLSMGMNFAHNVTSSTDLSVLRAAGIAVMQGTSDTPANTGSETVGWHYEEPSTFADIQSQAAVASGRGLTGRFQQCSFTWNQIQPGGNLGGVTMPTIMAQQISSSPVIPHLNVPGADIYWFAGAANSSLQFEGGFAHGNGAAATADQMARGSNYGDMVDVMRAWLGTYPAPVGAPYIETEDGLLTGAGITRITPPQFNWAVWATVIHGARWILYFGTTSNFGSGSTFGFGTTLLAGQTVSMATQATATNGLVQQLAPVINSPFALNYASVTPAGYTFPSGSTAWISSSAQAIDVMAKYYTAGGSLANGFYIFACTRCSQTQTNIAATFTTAGSYTGPVTVVGESRTVTAVNGVFSDTFALASTVHIYQIPFAASSPWGTAVSDPANDEDGRSAAVRGLLW